MQLASASPITVLNLWDGQRRVLSDEPRIAEVGEAIVEGLYAQFEESLALVRAFLTIPHGLLPPSKRGFAERLARSVGQEADLGAHTPVHTLLATRGRRPEWNSPETSTGHVAIPLLSDKFVGGIPMMARLLKDLGLPLSWVQDAGAELKHQLLGAEAGCFWVGDAATARDELGRKIIPGEQFVAEQAVKSVFAVGGVVFGGAVLSLIFFSTEPVEMRVARGFMPLVNALKAIIVGRCSMSNVFAEGGA